jgi:mannose/fructose-specific phosphotransferase system component IIA
MSEGGLRGVVVAHSELAAALIGAVDRIVGLDPGVLVALSNEGLGPDAIGKRLDELAGEGPVLVFTDLREGSCGMAAQRACRGTADRVVVTGVNLPILLDFALMRHMPQDALVERILARGRDGIQAFGGGR